MFGPCDICHKRDAADCGRWVAWCKRCEKKGREKDRELILENELEDGPAGLTDADVEYLLNHDDGTIADLLM